MIELDGQSLTLEQVAAAAAGASFRPSLAALDRVARGAAAMAQAARTSRVYGRNTGVGANRDVDVVGAGRALLRSHAGGWGEPVPAPVVRALGVIRANQLLVGASGASPTLPAVLAALAELPEPDLPVVHAAGSVGTADLTALAEIGLALVGERPRRSGGLLRVDEWHDDDALPLLSSSALTLAEATLGTLALQRLSAQATTVYALSSVALHGSREAIGPVVDAVTPFDGAREVAATVRRLLEPVPAPRARLQDFFGLRCFPQVHGPFVDELGRLRAGVERLVNTGSENPALVGVDPPVVAHHGGFQLSYLSLWLDATQLALAASARSGLSRISHLLTDPSNGLPKFLSGMAPGANGLLVLEYSAASAVERLRALAAAPGSLGTAHLSAGIEDDASHAAQGAVRLTEAVPAYRHLIAIELVTAVRAVRLRAAPLAGPLGELMRHLVEIGRDDADHDLGGEIAAALTALDDLPIWP